MLAIWMGENVNRLHKCAGRPAFFMRHPLDKAPHAVLDIETAPAKVRGLLIHRPPVHIRQDSAREPTADDIGRMEWCHARHDRT